MTTHVTSRRRAQAKEISPAVPTTEPKRGAGEAEEQTPAIGPAVKASQEESRQRKERRMRARRDTTRPRLIACGDVVTKNEV